MLLKERNIYIAIYIHKYILYYHNKRDSRKQPREFNPPRERVWDAAFATQTTPSGLGVWGFGVCERGIQVWGLVGRHSHVSRPAGRS